MAKTDAWHHGVSPSSHQLRLESLTTTLQRLADAGLGAASIITNLHHRRIDWGVGYAQKTWKSFLMVEVT
jgi:hypothetical protein